jgi:hypothetical protein
MKVRYCKGLTVAIFYRIAKYPFQRIAYNGLSGHFAHTPQVVIELKRRGRVCARDLSRLERPTLAVFAMEQITSRL